MNAKILIAAVAALSLASASATDAHHNKRHKRHHAPTIAYIQTAPAIYPGPRPVWAVPGSCYTDEGYGRFRPCDASPSGGR